MDSSDPGTRERHPAPSLTSGKGLLGRPLFWLIAVGTLWSVPLIKSLGAELPTPLPGMDGAPLELKLPVERGDQVSLGELAGQLLVIRSLPLADVEAALLKLNRLHELRNRLRGLGSEVIFIHIASGGSLQDLSALLDSRPVRKPLHVFLHDAGSEAWDRLCDRAGVDRSLESLLLDRHARLRGAYSGTVQGVDSLVRDAGQLANWPGSDPPLGAPTQDPR